MSAPTRWPAMSFGAAPTGALPAGAVEAAVFSREVESGIPKFVGWTPIIVPASKVRHESRAHFASFRPDPARFLNSIPSRLSGSKSGRLCSRSQAPAWDRTSPKLRFGHRALEKSIPSHARSAIRIVNAPPFPKPTARRRFFCSLPINPVPTFSLGSQHSGWLGSASSRLDPSHPSARTDSAHRDRVRRPRRRGGRAFLIPLDYDFISVPSSGLGPHSPEAPLRPPRTAERRPKRSFGGV